MHLDQEEAPEHRKCHKEVTTKKILRKPSVLKDINSKQHKQKVDQRHLKVLSLKSQKMMIKKPMEA